MQTNRILAHILPNPWVVVPEPVLVQPRLLIKLLPLQASGLVDMVGVVLLLDLPPGAVPRRPAHLSGFLSVGVDQRNGRAQVVGQDVPDRQRASLFVSSLHRVVDLALELGVDEPISIPAVVCGFRR